MPGVAGRSGRRAKPVAKKELAGNPGKRQLNKEEPDFGRVTNVDPPDYLCPHATEMWKRVAPLLCAQKILQFTDLHNLEVFCSAYGNWRIAQADLVKNGPVISGAEGGSIKNPAATVVKESVSIMASFGAMLGLDPSSRQHLVGGGNGQADNPFKSLING